MRLPLTRPGFVTFEAMKARGVEPTYGMIVASCPKGVLNSETNQAVGKKRMYDVFRENCADEGAEENWEHKPRYSKKALTAQMMAKRLAFGVHVQSWCCTPTWFYNHVVWVDICNSIFPRSERKASEQALREFEAAVLGHNQDLVGSYPHTWQASHRGFRRRFLRR